MKIVYIGPFLHIISEGYRFTRHLPVEVDLATATRLLACKTENNPAFIEAVDHVVEVAAPLPKKPVALPEPE